MARLIDADKLIMFLSDLQLGESPNDTDDQVKREKQHTVWLTIEKVIQAVKEQPTTDAEPVQHGHIVWKQRHEGAYRYLDVRRHNCGTTESIEIERPAQTKVPYCSQCGKRLDDTFMNYCPHCGAKMDGKEG